MSSVNSEFTKGVFKETFKVLDARGVVPDVLYPAVVIPVLACSSASSGDLYIRCNHDDGFARSKSGKWQ
jgi:hypothetical protein